MLSITIIHTQTSTPFPSIVDMVPRESGRGSLEHACVTLVFVGVSYVFNCMRALNEPHPFKCRFTFGEFENVSA